MLRITVFLTVLAFGFLTVHYAQENNAKKFEGVWVGDLDIKGRALPIVFKLLEKDSKLNGTAESPNQRNGERYLENIVIKENKIQFEIPAGQSFFDGIYKEENKKIEGTFILQQQGFPLVLTRKENAPLLETKYESIWEGKINSPSGSSKFIVKTIKNPDGGLSGFLDTPDKGVINFPISLIIISEKELKFDITSFQIGYYGIIDKTTMIAKGVFSQRGQEFPLELKKVDKPTEK